ncbi:MAG TPA: hypothetical protein VGA34_02335 [Alteraurantiacibacter sp.]|jgi:hypothetical protein
MAFVEKNSSLQAGFLKETGLPFSWSCHIGDRPRYPGNVPVPAS